MKCVLNVGGADKSIPIPAHFGGWRHDLLDIDPRVNPDVLSDARELIEMSPAIYDAVYCSHNLEHYYHHDALKVAQGFAHILKPDGFAHIIVPNMLGLMRHVTEKNLDVEDFLYESASGPITVRDMIYGYQKHIQQSGTDFYAHKTCFSPKSLTALMYQAGFTVCASAEFQTEVFGFFFKSQPTEELCKLLGVTITPAR